MDLGLSLSLSASRRAGGFSPSVLFAASEPGIWLDPSDPATVFSNTAGTTQAVIDDPVALVLDKSGNENHATQPVLASRPILGRVPATGRRNFAISTEDFTNTSGLAWAWRGGVTISANATTSPIGTLTADLITEDTSTGNHYVGTLNVGFVAGVTNAASFWLKSNGKTEVTIRAMNANNLGATFNLVAGTVVARESANISATIEAAGDGWYRCSITFDPTKTNPYISVLWAGAGDGTSGIFIWGAQLELGSEATPYQRVGSNYDVTEAGVPSLHRLFRDGVDDSLNATLPDLGTDATVAYASDQGITILTGQTIGAGSFNVLRDSWLYGMIVNNRPWTAAETAGVTKWLERRMPT